MALILCIETSTRKCSVALGENGATLFSKENSGAEYTHAEELHPFIKHVMDESGKSFSQIEAIAVSKGPGSFTGLRIGVSAAKGFCFALDVPLIAIETLELMFRQAKKIQPAFDLYIPMIDARRMEVYTKAFRADGKVIQETSASIIDENFFAALGKNHALIFGDGAEKCKPFLRNGDQILEGLFPLASEMISIAEEKFARSQFEDVAYFEPYYLKEFIAIAPRSS